MKRGLKYGAAVRVAIRARRLEPRLRLPVTYSQRHADELGTPVAVNYDKEREKILLKIMERLEPPQRRGLTADNVTAIIQQWAGPLAKHVRVDKVALVRGVPVVGGVSNPDRSGEKSRLKTAPTKTKTLRLVITNNTVLMELRGRLPALKAALKGTGIEEVRL